MNIIDILKRAAEALGRAAAVVIMERDSSEFEREAENLRAAITEMESAKLPEPTLSDFFFSANPEPTNYYTRDQMLAFCAGADKPWRDAVENELIVAHILNESHDDPRKAVQDAISWNVQVALDPAVSSDAQALIERGRMAGRVPLTEQAIWDAVGHGVVGGIGLPSKAVAVARAIERAHGIGESGNAE